jgi:hypothetical protein
MSYLCAVAKCTLCHGRKGKRECRAHPDLICSLCCGQVRSPDVCDGCSYYQSPVRRYDDLPRFSTHDMQDPALQDLALPIEAAVCSLDRERGFRLTDAQAIQIFELLLDVYAFGDSWESVSARSQALGCDAVLDTVERELQSHDRTAVAKVLTTVRRMACRRAEGGRQHLDFLQDFCGPSPRSGGGRFVDD